MKRLVILLTVACGLLASTAAAFASGPSGAIFTTFWDGSAVNANHFQYATDVYLDGGPGANAKSTAAALPEGDYVFQVTDPNGSILLSEDPAECRVFHVDAVGAISSVGGGDCAHATGTDVNDGGLTVQLWPFYQSPNQGGVYKVWVTPLNQFDPSSGDFGFSPSASKTDNFKVSSYGGGLPD